MGVKGLHWVDCKALVGRKLVARDLFGNEFARFDYDANNGAETARIPDFRHQTEERYRSIILSALETLEEEAVADEVGECRYCANTGWFYGDPDLNTFCGCAFGTLRKELSINAEPTPVQKEEEGQTVSEDMVERAVRVLRRTMHMTPEERARAVLVAALVKP